MEFFFLFVRKCQESHLFYILDTLKLSKLHILNLTWLFHFKMNSYFLTQLVYTGWVQKYEKSIMLGNIFLFVRTCQLQERHFFTFWTGHLGIVKGHFKKSLIQNQSCSTCFFFCFFACFFSLLFEILLWSGDWKFPHDVPLQN